MIDEPWPPEPEEPFEGERPPHNSAALARRLLAQDRESDWLEFKHNNANPEEIGEYLSALSNSALLTDQPHGYMLWGVDDDSLAIVGTSFEPHATKHGNEDLVPWLNRLLDPKPWFEFLTTEIEGKRMVVLQVEAARERPTQFRGKAFVRVDTCKQNLHTNAAHERRLWNKLNSFNLESSLIATNLTIEHALAALDHGSYFQLTGRQTPPHADQIADILAREGFLHHDVAAGWSVTALGALLLARRLSDFPSVDRKAVRLVRYQGTNRVSTERTIAGDKGYASGYGGLLSVLRSLLPSNEVITAAGAREERPTYPDLAVRELVANLLMHQDLAVKGAGPLIEIFEDRVEFTNPGQPLISPDRFIDSPPRSRNERLARAMRRMGLCEELGSGWDKIAWEIERHQMPAPDVEVSEQQTRVTLFGPRPIEQLGREDRLRAVYQHACLKYVSNEPMNNSSLRDRLGIADRNAAQASRLIRDAVDAGLIAPYDPTAGPRAIRYVPFWAAPEHPLRELS